MKIVKKLNRFDIALDGIEYDASCVETPVTTLKAAKLERLLIGPLGSLDQNIEVRTQNYNRQIEYFNQYTSFLKILFKMAQSGFCFSNFDKGTIPFSKAVPNLFGRRNIQTESGYWKRSATTNGAKY